MPSDIWTLTKMAVVEKENILLFGATGYIGAYILNQLVVAKDNFGRIAIFTSTDTALKKQDLLETYKAEGFEVIIGNVRHAKDIVGAFEGHFPNTQSPPCKTDFDQASIQ